MMTGKSLRNRAKGTERERRVEQRKGERKRIKGLNVEKGDGGSLFSGDRQGKVVLS